MGILYDKEVSYAEVLATSTRWEPPFKAPRAFWEVYEAVIESAPTGSGFDNGITFRQEKSSLSKLVFETSFHHMNDDGYYTHWTYHTITVVPTFVNNHINIKVTGRGGEMFKDYVGDVFYYWLTTKTETR